MIRNPRLMTLTLLWLAGRLIGSVAASILQKRLLSAGIGVGYLWLATYGLLILPGAMVFALFAPAPGHGFWPAALLAAAFDVAGNLAMASALRGTDLSIFGPLNALRPVLAWAAGWLLLNEVPTRGGLAGLTIISAGAFWLLKPSTHGPGTEPTSGHFRSVAWRLLGLGLSTIGATFLKQATLAGSPESTLAVWVIAGGSVLLVAFIAIPRLRRSLRHPIPPEQKSLLMLHAPVFFAMQWLTLKVFQHTLLSYSFAFFQLGMILQVMAGRWIFREPDFRRRLTACALMCIGAFLVLVAG